MARRPTTQLDLDWLAPIRWNDLSPAVRERLGELLADLLRQAAGGRNHAEGSDDQ